MYYIVSFVYWFVFKGRKQQIYVGLEIGDLGGIGEGENMM